MADDSQTAPAFDPENPLAASAATPNSAANILGNSLQAVAGMPAAAKDMATAIGNKFSDTNGDFYQAVQEMKKQQGQTAQAAQAITGNVPSPLQPPSVPDVVAGLGQNPTQGLQQNPAQGPQTETPTQQGPQQQQMSLEQFVQTPQAKKAADSNGFNGLMDSYKNYTDQFISSQKALAGAQQDAAKYESGKLGELAKQQYAWQQAEAAKGVQREQDLNEQMNEFGKIKQEFTDLSAQKVDPRHFWNQATEGLGGKIQAGLALALGSIGGALTGKGGNVALDILNRSIDRDIDAQKFNIQNSRDNLQSRAGLQNTIFNKMLDKYKVVDLAETATRALYTNQIELQLRQKGLELQGTTAGENAKIAIAQAQMQGAQLQQQMKQQMAVYQALNGTGQPGADQGSQGLSPGQVAMLPKEIQERYAPGYGFGSGSKTDTEEFQKYRQGAEPAMAALNKAATFAQTYNRANPVERAKMDVMAKQLMGDLREDMGFKTLTEGDQELLGHILGNPNKFLTTRSIEVAKLKQAIENAHNKFNEVAKARGFQPKTMPVDFKTFKGQ